MKLKKGDLVKVIKGKDKGKTGKVEKILPVVHKVVVADVNLYKRHVKARNQNEKSEIKTIVKPLDVSSVALVCPKCGKPTRIGYTLQKEVKVRMCKKCEQIL